MYKEVFDFEYVMVHVHLWIVEHLRPVVLLILTGYHAMAYHDKRNIHDSIAGVCNLQYNKPNVRQKARLLGSKGGGNALKSSKRCEA